MIFGGRVGSTECQIIWNSKFYFQMELEELSRIDHQEGPKGSSRTIKPEDRCVISYNFQQTNSQNYTHNLLIGMFAPPNKKSHNIVSQISIEPPKSKAAAISTHPKKIKRKDGEKIGRVYNNQIDPSKYVNQFSGWRARTENHRQPDNSISGQLMPCLYNGSGKQSFLKEKSIYQPSSIKNQNPDAGSKKLSKYNVKPWEPKEGNQPSSVYHQNPDIYSKKESKYHEKSSEEHEINKPLPASQLNSDNNFKKVSRWNANKPSQVKNVNQSSSIPRFTSDVNSNKVSKNNNMKPPESKGMNQFTGSVRNFDSDVNSKNVSKLNGRPPEKAIKTLTNFNQALSSHYKSQEKGFSSEKQKVFNRKQEGSKYYPRNLKENPNNRGIGNSFSLKRGDKSLTAKKPTEEQVQNEDITANNQIRGYKIADKKANRTTYSVSKSKGQPNINYSSNLGPSLNRESQTANAIKKQPISHSKQGKQRTLYSNQVVDESKSKRQDLRLEKRKGKEHEKNERNERHNKQNISSKEKNLQKGSFESINKISNKKAENPTQTQNGIDKLQQQPFIKHKASQQKSFSRSKVIESTVPRLSQQKTRKFKNWRESSTRQKQKKLSRKFNDSPLGKQRNSLNLASPQRSNNTRRSLLSNRSKEIDLDAEEQDPFGLLAQKNVTGKGKGKDKKMKPSKFKVQKETQQDQIDEGEGKSQKRSESSQSSGINSCSFRSQKLEQDEVHPTCHLNQNGEMNYQNVGQVNPQDTPIFVQNQHAKVSATDQPHKKQGIQQIEHLIQENGSQISSIDEEDSMLVQKPQTKDENNASDKSNDDKWKEQEGNAQSYKIIITPDNVNPGQNLENLLKATEEVKTNQKQLEPILNNVQVELGQQHTPNQEQTEDKVNPNITTKPNKEEKKDINEPQTTQIGDLQKEKIENDEKRSNTSEEDSKEKGGNSSEGIFNKNAEGKVSANKEETVNKNQDTRVGKNSKNTIEQKNQCQSPRVAMEAESDYHEEQLDKIEEMPDNPKEQNKSLDFFQCNLNQTSKMSDPNLSINYTKYQVIDKDTTNYTRAPILSFLYEIPKLDSFVSSVTPQVLLKNIKKVEDINEEIIDQAVNIIASIDPWIVQRIFEPYESKEGNIGVWLYCYGIWKLFQENKQSNFKLILRQAVRKAVKLINEDYELQTVIKLISGVRVMKLKSEKRKIFNQLQYSLRKGHVIKAYTSKDSKWKGKVFEVSKVETTRQNQNVLQIRQEKDTYWVKEQKFKSIFQHFLLICTRHSHFWTYRSLQHKQGQKTVLTLTSHVPSHGSLTLFYPSKEKSSLLLYKELESKVLKYMGKIEEKANQNGNLYFQFRLHGTYSLFLETPTSCLLALESTTPLQIGSPEFILKETLRNEECEYVELSQNRSKSREKQNGRNNDTLQKLRETFIKMIVKK